MKFGLDLMTDKFNYNWFFTFTEKFMVDFDNSATFISTSSMEL